MKDVNVEIITRLKDLRIENGLSQKDVANILKISRTNYNRYETCVRNIPLEYIDILANYYQVTVDYLFGREV